MKRVSRITIPTKFGYIRARLEFGFEPETLTPGERDRVISRVEEDVVSALRGAPYAGDVPLREVEFS